MRHACTALPIAFTTSEKQQTRSGPRKVLRMFCLFLLWPALVLNWATLASAHEAGAPFSGAMIEPLLLHHAHLEDEQRLNLFSLRKLRESDTRRHALESELELAWANSDFTFGIEVFVPFASWPAADGGRHVSVGDIEIRPVKYAFVNRPDLVISTATAVGLPTGDRTKQPESGNTWIAQHLFADKTIGNWYVGANVGVDRRVRGERGTGVEYGVALAYSFIRGTAAGGVAPARPTQRLVVSPSIELIGEKRWSGEDAGERTLSWLPGVALWWPRSGLQLRAGVKLPLSGSQESERTFLLQIGAHRNWDEMRSGKRR